MIGVDHARRTAGERLRSKLTTWSITPPEAPILVISLKPPTEREALADQATAEAWARAWRGAVLPVGAHVDWELRTWQRLGRQEVPVRLRLEHPEAAAAFAGGGPERAWRTLSRRVAAVRAALGPSPEVDAAVRRHGATLMEWPGERLEMVLAVVAWLVENPAVGLRPRQVPIRGVDTKWLAAHRAVVTDLHRARTGRELGLVDADRLVRVRVLDPALAQTLGGLDEFAAPASRLASLTWTPPTVVISENLESLLALPKLAGVVAIHGSGYAVDVVGGFGWVRDARVLYWGDLDSHGFAILHRLRTHLPTVASFLMDVHTLTAHRDLWVPEPKPAHGDFNTLTPDEATALAAIRAEGDVRLEQERIPWATASAALERAVRGA